MKPTKSILILLSLFLIFSCGEKDGKWTEYYENGRIKSERIFKDGEVVDGKYISYYDNGQIWDERNYKDGKLDGKFTIYYENGILQRINLNQIEGEGNFKDGEKDGKWTYYNEDGSLIGEGIYQNGERWNGLMGRMLGRFILSVSWVISILLPL